MTLTKQERHFRRSVMDALAPVLDLLDGSEDSAGAYKYTELCETVARLLQAEVARVKESDKVT